MKYRELLNRCTEKPGWIRSRDQHDIEYEIRYRLWAEEMNRSYERQKNGRDRPR